MYWRGVYKNRKNSRRRSSTLFSKLQNGSSSHREFGGIRTIVGSPDITVIFEESSALWHEAESQSRLAELLQYKREHCSYMIHSVPEHLIRMLTKEMKTRGAYLFITELQEQYYESFGKSWREFVSAMAVEEDDGNDNLLITIGSSATWIKSMAHDALKGLSCPLF